MDALSPARRSELMGRVKSKATAPERALGSALRRAGLRPTRGGGEGLAGRPDIVFAKAKVAVFVDGCFWHGCPEHGRAPLGSAYWAAKLAANTERDLRVSRELELAGWMALRIWEHDLRTQGAASEQASRVVAAVQARAGGDF